MSFVSTVSSTISAVYAHVSTTVASLHLEQYADAVAPYWQQVVAQASPAINKAWTVAEPHVAPYLELLHPHMKEAQPHLSAISRSELALILGGIFGGIIALQFFLFFTASCKKGASKWKAFSPLVFWLLMCTVIHSWIEMTFVFFRSDSAIFNGMNLYGAADFRYGAPLEDGTAAMEAITALITGPLCFALAYATVMNRNWRWPVQIILCTCQLYGLTWFIFHPFFLNEEVASSDPFLFWVVFVGMNAPWGIIPPVLLYQAFAHINKALNAADKIKAVEAPKAKTNGNAAAPAAKSPAKTQ